MTVALGVNFDEVYDPDRTTSSRTPPAPPTASRPVAKTLHETIGIRHGLMSTVHAYTSDQNLQDGPHKDMRRARAAAINMLPTTTGAAKALGPGARAGGRLHGYAMRVPLATGSVVDLTVEAERSTRRRKSTPPSRPRRERAARGHHAYSEEPIVSSDIVKSPYSSIFDAGFTSVIDGTCVKDARLV